MTQQPTQTTNSNLKAPTLPKDGTWLDYSAQTNFTLEQLADAEGVAPKTIERHLFGNDDPFGIESDDGPYRVGATWRLTRESVIRYHRWCRAAGVRRREEWRARVTARAAAVRDA